ncbi:MAG TPA: TetR/AcrR family transcriptional regulator, partial [Gemmatimonadales bacterium]|nr:TetR/AcrR family transcriptional regulator [Gemmatimonadales bacterium]
MATRARGRPRDPAIDAAILTATRNLLVEVGYAALTMEAVAARAGIGKPSLYRRYPTKAALVFEAVFGRTKANPDPDTGTLVEDLREAYSWAVEEFAAPEARAALPGLFADLAANPALGQLVRAMVVDPEYQRVLAALERACARHEIREDADLILAIDAFTGTALVRVLLLDRPLDRQAGDRLVDLLVHGLAPRPAPRR